MDKPYLFAATCALLLTFVSQSTNAELFSRYGGKIIYESDRNISWLANGNLAESNTFGVAGIETDGSMRWFTGKAQEWLNAMNSASYLNRNDWRFPAAVVHPDPTCSNVQPTYSIGTGCTDSDMGDLYYVGLAAFERSGSGLVYDIGPFKNVRADAYWSGTPQDDDHQYSFHFGSGGQGKSYSGFFHVWPVLDGDVSITLLRCDLNDNGEVDAGDLSQVVRMTLGSIADDLDCDINNSGFGDGVISLADLVIISRIVLGIIPEIHN